MTGRGFLWKLFVIVSNEQVRGMLRMYTVGGNLQQGGHFLNRIY